MKYMSLSALIFVVAGLGSSALAQGSARVVTVKSGEDAYKVKRGGSAQISVVIEINDGYHINSNRPSDKNLIPTALKVEKASGFSAGPVTYPKAKLQKFEFSTKPLSVFEGKTVLKLNVRAMPAAPAGAQILKGKLTVQACNDQACLRPQTIDVSIPIQVE